MAVNNFFRMKKALLILGGGAVTLVLALVIFLLTFDANAYKPRMEAAASQATGMNVRINGKMRLALFPHAGFLLEEILIQNQGADVVAVKRTEATVRLLPLLKREVFVKHLRFIAPRVFITKDETGRFNIETPEKKPEEKKFHALLFGAEEIVIKGGYLQYLDKRTGEKTEASACDFTIHNLSADAGDFFRRLSFEGDFSCGELKREELRISAIRGIMKVHEGILEANPITTKIFGGDGQGSIRVEFAGEIPVYTVDFGVTKVRFEEMLGAFKQKKSVHGELALKWRLAMKGKNAAEMTRTAQGNILLEGKNLLFKGIDIDRMLEKYEKSTNITLIDVGAVLIAGPLGLVVTKGYDFGNAYWESQGGESAIRKLISHWTVKNGVAEAEDVALSTGKNRVALKGRLDFVKEQFDDVTMAVVDEKGCAMFSQHIHGPFRHPRSEKVNRLRSMAGPIINLYKETKKFLGVGECRIFYVGSLKHPE
jgi:AsmA protein